MRAVAVLAVMTDHTYVFSGGYLGVDVFFVLSGFLITSLLLEEWDRRGGQISFRDFYTRRALRILPALGVVVIAAVIFESLIAGYDGGQGGPYATATLDAVPAVMLFAGNWVRALDPSAVLGSLGALGHTWSLAVEEQFYLLWPATFALLMRRHLSRERLAILFCLLAVAEMVYRFTFAHLGTESQALQNRIYFGTDTHSDGLLIGCALAFWLASGATNRSRVLLGTLARRAAWPAAVVLLLLFIGGNFTDAAIDIPVAVLATTSLVAAVALGELPAALRRFLTSQFAIRIGRRSYGLYLWQYVLIAAAETLCAPYTGFFPVPAGLPRLVFATALSAAVAASFLAAELSYRFIELPALRLKRRFRAEPAPVMAGSLPTA